MNGSHGWFGPADPTPPPQAGYDWQYNNFNYATEDSQSTENLIFTSLTGPGTYGFTPAPIPTYYSPLDVTFLPFDHLANQLYQHDTSYLITNYDAGLVDPESGVTIYGASCLQNPYFF